MLPYLATYVENPDKSYSYKHDAVMAVPVFVCKHINMYLFILISVGNYFQICTLSYQINILEMLRSLQIIETSKHHTMLLEYPLILR